MLANTLTPVLRVAGPAFFVAIQGSSLQTALNIRASESVGKLSSIPFLSLFTNCAVWTIYGLRIRDKTVLIPNALGILSGAICASLYHLYMGPKKPVLLYTLAALIIGFCSQAGTTLIGTIGCALAVATCGSPLATIRTVIQDESTESMPFFTSLMFWFNALSWSSYGLFVSKDVMIYGPNLIGLALASIQMAMYVIFGMPPKGKKVLL